jgi:glycosyltransferase involved in cell wall biosynthesis
MSEQAQPTRHSVAVVVPVYNCERFVEEALASLELQTRRPERVVIVDDGSTDRTGEIIGRFKAHSSLPIEVITQRNSGIAAARNTALERCTEDFIAFLDGDDTFYPPFLEQAAGALARNADLVVCFLDRDVVDSDGRFMRRDLDHPDFRAMRIDRRADGTSVIAQNPLPTLAAGNVIPIGLMVRHDACRRVGGFDEAQRMVEDKPFLMRLAKLGTFGFIDEPLGIWRRHSDNTSGRTNAYQMAYYDELALARLEREAHDWNLTDAELSAIQAERGRNPARLLYTASDEARPEFMPLVMTLVRDGRAPFRQTLRAFARYGWRRISTQGRKRSLT